MRTKFFTPLLLTCTLFCTAYADSASHQSGVAENVIKKSHSDAQEALTLARSIDEKVRAAMKRQHVTEHTNPAITIQIAKEQIMPHVAKQTIARLVAGPQAWKKASSEERKQFADALANTITNAYAGVLISYSNPEANQEFAPPRESSQIASVHDRVEINSLIKTAPDAPPLRVSYRFIREPGSNGWKVYDINGDNISLVKSYRSQIQPKLSQGQSLAAITAELKQHNKNVNTHEV
jgi:phospholipid transport system substrate-binding protein